jgi:hypothetical protein
MQLRAIADVAPVVTMATEAILEMMNISNGPTCCGHNFCEVLSQNVELSLRNMKLKLS